MSKFYGKNHDEMLENSEFVKIIRKHLQKQYPNCKFTVRLNKHCIEISLVEANFNPFRDDEEIAYYFFNPYYISKDSNLTKQAKKMFTEIHEFVKSYNYITTDSSCNYCYTNFFHRLKVGKWDKPFIQKP